MHSSLGKMVLWVFEAGGRVGWRTQAGDWLQRSAVAARAGSPPCIPSLTVVTQLTEQNCSASREAGSEQIAWVLLRSPSL